MTMDNLQTPCKDIPETPKSPSLMPIIKSQPDYITDLANNDKTTDDTMSKHSDGSSDDMAPPSDWSMTACPEENRVDGLIRTWEVLIPAPEFRDGEAAVRSHAAPDLTTPLTKMLVSLQDTKESTPDEQLNNKIGFFTERGFMETFSDDSSLDVYEDKVQDDDAPWSKSQVKDLIQDFSSMSELVTNDHPAIRPETNETRRTSDVVLESGRMKNSFREQEEKKEHDVAPAIPSAKVNIVSVKDSSKDKEETKQYNVSPVIPPAKVNSVSAKDSFQEQEEKKEYDDAPTKVNIVPPMPPATKPEIFIPIVSTESEILTETLVVEEQNLSKTEPVVTLEAPVVMKDATALPVVLSVDDAVRAQMLIKKIEKSEIKESKKPDIKKLKAVNVEKKEGVSTLVKIASIDKVADEMMHCASTEKAVVAKQGSMPDDSVNILCPVKTAAIVHSVNMESSENQVVTEQGVADDRATIDDLVKTDSVKKTSEMNQIVADDCAQKANTSPREDAPLEPLAIQLPSLRALMIEDRFDEEKVADEVEPSEDNFGSEADDIFEEKPVGSHRWVNERETAMMREVEMGDQDAKVNTSNEPPFWRSKKCIVIAVVVLVAIVGAVIGAVLATTSKGEQGTASADRGVAPPLVVTLVPTSSPTISFLEELLNSVALKGGTEFDDPLTYQSRALDWLANNPTVSLDDKAQVVRLYSLACLYFANTLDGAWKQATNWLSTNFTECNWYGVICNEQGIMTALSLSTNRLSGALPAELSLLTTLYLLWIQENPRLVGTIPSELAALSLLESFSLFGNNLSGTIPSELGRMTNLKNMWLSQNVLTGTIPSSFGKLENLLKLEFHSNALMGDVPLSVCALRADESFVSLVVDCTVNCTCCSQCW